MLADLRDGAARNPIWFGAVATITGVQGFFGWEFWGAISADPQHQLALRALGLGFVAGEVVALDMASRADLASEPKRAGTLRALWAVLAVTTFSADISALSRVLRESDAPRATVAAQFDANQVRIAELEHRIDIADDPFDGELLSVPAYDAAIAGKNAEIATARAGRVRMWRMLQLQDHLTDLQTARAAALQIDAMRDQLDVARQAQAARGERPQTGAVEFKPFADMATGLARNLQHLTGAPASTTVSPDDVRAGMAWIATFAMKLMLTFGVWVGLQRGRGTGADKTPSPAPIRETEEQTNPDAPVALKSPARRTANVTTFNRRNQRFGR